MSIGCDRNLSLQSLGCELWHLEPMFVSLIPPTWSASRRCKQIPLLHVFSFFSVQRAARLVNTNDMWYLNSHNISPGIKQSESGARCFCHRHVKRRVGNFLPTSTFGVICMYVRVCMCVCIIFSVSLICHCTLNYQVGIFIVGKFSFFSSWFASWVNTCLFYY